MPPAKTIAVIGASNHRHKFGNKALRAYRDQGYTVVPVNRHEAEIEGQPAYASVTDYPGRIDEATVYVPPSEGLVVVEALAAKGVTKVWFNPGADDPAVVDRARALGLDAIVACSILAIGRSPSVY